MCLLHTALCFVPRTIWSWMKLSKRAPNSYPELIPCNLLPYSLMLLCSFFLQVFNAYLSQALYLLGWKYFSMLLRLLPRFAFAFRSSELLIYLIALYAQIFFVHIFSFTFENASVTMSLTYCSTAPVWREKPSNIYFLQLFSVYYECNKHFFWICSFDWKLRSLISLIASLVKRRSVVLNRDIHFYSYKLISW